MKKILILFTLFCTLPAIAQQRDSRIREYLSPTRIVWQQHNELIQDAANLLLPGNGQAGLVDRTICKMTSTKQKHPAILFDFGKELQGGIQLVTGGFPVHRPISVRIRLGESVSEAMCEIDGKNGASNDHAMRDCIVSLPWMGVMEIGNSVLPESIFSTTLPNCI